ncbi:hypothetical protein EVAR_100258_1 [Eumeta japonica]|uniref:Tesmin/TSO1-like CXC domain-containing protein n=1 Tax=Eumeta variegata TaxID=151549 RepID=A0A4C1SHC8_EUMVA|nr:hypothetical protein EVAR_100258_1 [Eumeta japonica]
MHIMENTRPNANIENIRYDGFLSSGRCLLVRRSANFETVCANIGFSENFRRNFRFHSRSRRRSVPTPSHSTQIQVMDTLRDVTIKRNVQSWLGNYNDPEDWGWKKCGKLLMPVQNSKPPAPPELLKLIFCKCKGNCGAMCGCRKAGMKCSAVCFHCSGETCSNVMELSELINENDFDDDPPTLTPLPSPVLSLVFNSETRSDAEPLPGPSKRLRTE